MITPRTLGSCFNCLFEALGDGNAFFGRTVSHALDDDIAELALEIRPGEHTLSIGKPQARHEKAC